MIEKRFEFVIDDGKDTIYDLSKKGSILENFYEIEEMLNNLNNENEQLKQQLKEKDDFIDEVWRKYEDAHGLSIDNTDWF